MARPLYVLIKETQKTNTHLIQWGPEAEAAFRTLKQALTRAPVLSPATGQNLCMSQKEWDSSWSPYLDSRDYHTASSMLEKSN